MTTAVQRRPSRRGDESRPRRYFTLRRALLIGTVLVVGLAWFVVNFAGLTGFFLEVPLNDVQSTVGDVAVYAPLATMACALAAALSPSGRWSLRLWCGVPFCVMVWVLATGLLGTVAQ